MANLYIIEVGDTVNVEFITQHGMYGVKVLHIPQDTGDAWVARTKTGDIVYIQSYETMRLVEKAR